MPGGCTGAGSDRGGAGAECNLGGVGFVPIIGGAAAGGLAAACIAWLGIAPSNPMAASGSEAARLVNHFFVMLFPPTMSQL
jgi:hypothetical protein